MKLKLPFISSEKPFSYFISIFRFPLGFDLYRFGTPRFFSLSSFALFSFQGTISNKTSYSLYLLDSVLFLIQTVFVHKHICSDYIIFRRLCVCENEAVRLVREFSLTYKIRKIGGDEEDRTPDPLLARQVLSQLSYTPKFLLILRQDFLGIHMYCLRRLSSSKQKLLCLAFFIPILGCLPFFVRLCI